MIKLKTWHVAGMAMVASTMVASSALAQSVARQWNDEQLAAIRRDLARPTVHARNLYHVSAAMWDAWAAFDPGADAVIAVNVPDMSAGDVIAARNMAVSYAAYRVLNNRFSTGPGAAVSLAAFTARMNVLGYDPSYTGTTGGTPADLGNAIAAAVIAHGLADGSNQQNGYANQQYVTINDPLIVDLPGNPWAINPSRYQPLALDFFVDQNGNPIPGGFPPFLSPEWGFVTPFALTPADRTVQQRGGYNWNVYLDPGPVPALDNAMIATFQQSHAVTLTLSGQLDPADGVMIDISPGAITAKALPANPADDFATLYDGYLGPKWGPGLPLNPVTGSAYAPNVVKRGDFSRVLAEFWADGPSSETPPGHWFKISNEVTSNLAHKRWGGVGPDLDALEWDVRLYVTLGGALHDTAISIWSVKGYHDAARPVTALRYMAMKGQSSNPAGPAYHPHGLPLVPGMIEVITAQTTAAGERHEELAGYEGKIAARTWRGPDYISNPAVDVAGCAWMLAQTWWPYQRPTFVTPPFGGYVSGHSGYSRCAADLLEAITGSPYFPGGMGVFNAVQNQYLVFEDGPSQTVQLQWATFQDAAAQSAYSRVWGGIHPPMDDCPARRIGRAIAPKALARAEQLFVAPACPADLNGNSMVDGADLGIMLGAWGPCAGSCVADLNGDGEVSGNDLGSLLAGWGACP